MYEVVVVPMDFNDKLIKLSIEQFTELLKRENEVGFKTGYEEGFAKGLMFKAGNNNE